MGGCLERDMEGSDMSVDLHDATEIKRNYPAILRLGGLSHIYYSHESRMYFVARLRVPIGEDFRYIGTVMNVKKRLEDAGVRVR